jgi:hypothetical protein
MGGRSGEGGGWMYEEERKTTTQAKIEAAGAKNAFFIFLLEKHYSSVGFLSIFY